MAIHLRNVVLDTADVPRLAEFYRELLGWSYPDGYEVGPEDYPDWRSIVGPQGQRLSFQQAESMTPTTWPDPTVPQQAHLDFLVDSVEELDSYRDRALALGAELRLDRRDDEEEPLWVLADPSGHLFCVFAWPGREQ